LSAIRDERAIASLEQLASSKYFEIRGGALYALRGIKDPRTLIQRLDDERPELQYRALITLNEIFNLNGDYGPSVKLFDGQPQKYIALWKKWWQEHGQFLCKPALST
jgi:HEAT repeat protein